MKNSVQLQVFSFIIYFVIDCYRSDSCYCSEAEYCNFYNITPTQCVCEGSLDCFPTIDYHFLTLKNFDCITLSRENLKEVAAKIIDLHITEFRRLNYINSDSFGKFSNLKTLFITNLPKLSTLSLDILLTEHTELDRLKITNTGLHHVPLMRLNENILKFIDLENNAIEKVIKNNLSIRTGLLTLSYNQISSIESWAFNNSEISEIRLKGNRKLKILPEGAFSGIRSLRVLNLSETSIINIPTSDLKELEILILRQTYLLKIIPCIYDFPNLKTAELTFSFHCCAFKLPERHDPMKTLAYQESHRKLEYYCDQMKTNALLPSISPSFSNKSAIIVSGISDNGDNGGNDDDNDDEQWHDSELMPEFNLNIFKCKELEYAKKRKPSCEPVADALNPCEDIMGYEWLRINVWVVIVIALLGNLCVLIVILSKPNDLTVPKFLICNLAFADLCMAVFLLMLAVQDHMSRGYYFNYAYDWQMGYGCKVAGFLTIFASQLSIFILSILTIERWFTIRRALYLNKFTFRRAVLATICGWIYALTMAALPLLGISSYSTTSLCLPMDTRRGLDMFYLLFMLLFASAAFVLMCSCYYQIYFSLNYDTRCKDGEYALAKKMILLVGTNFLCWAPVTFFAMTAVCGFPLIDITNSKILLVFFYPVNSCANPFLYAILTKSFKNDFLSLLAKFRISTRKYRRVYHRPKKTKNEIRRPSTSHTAL